MRKTMVMIAALAIAAPAAAQDNATSATPETVTANDATAAAGAETNGVLIEPATPTNGLTAGPGASPATAEPMSVDTAYGEPAPREDRGGFPWGVLGLLGLLGLIPRKKHD